MTEFSPMILLEEFLLLALDGEVDDLFALPADVMDSATAGAVLMDLQLCRRIDGNERDLFTVDSTPVGDSILDLVLPQLATAPVLTPRSIRTWLHELAEQGDELRLEALARLEARGLVSPEAQEWRLWPFGPRQDSAACEKAICGVKSRILEVILGDEIPSAHDTMLISLAEACGLFSHMLGVVEAVQAAPRIAKIARLDFIGQAVAQEIAGLGMGIAATSAIG